VPRRASPLSLLSLRATGGVLGAWLLYAVVEVTTGLRPLLYTFRAFGLISPVVGLLGLFVSFVALLEARRARTATWPALAAMLLSVAIAVVPFALIPYDPS
jgi:hypothetical protein